MVSVKGRVVAGVGDFGPRMIKHRDVFTDAAGEELYPGTLNVKIDREIKIQEEFKIPGADIDERGQDLLFENCLIDGIKAFRIRPFVLETGGGGHNDDTLEIASASYIPNAKVDTEVEVTFFRALT
jgi:CTP-dependent riboflavin kinase